MLSRKKLSVSDLRVEIDFAIFFDNTLLSQSKQILYQKRISSLWRSEDDPIRSAENAPQSRRDGRGKNRLRLRLRRWRAVLNLNLNLPFSVLLGDLCRMEVCG